MNYILAALGAFAFVMTFFAMGALGERAVARGRVTLVTLSISPDGDFVIESGGKLWSYSADRSVAVVTDYSGVQYVAPLQAVAQARIVVE